MCLYLLWNEQEISLSIYQKNKANIVYVLSGGFLYPQRRNSWHFRKMDETGNHHVKQNSTGLKRNLTFSLTCGILVIIYVII